MAYGWAFLQTQSTCRCLPLARRPAPTPQECASLVTRMAPGPSVARMLRGVLRYVADAFMLQLMSGGSACGPVPTPCNAVCMQRA